jgi:hypothetical protein
MKYIPMRDKSWKIGMSIALCGGIALAGCAVTGGVITPTAATQSDIDTAFTAICGPGGLLAAAAPFATTGSLATYYGEAVTLCANGEPTNAIVAGVDIFDIYLDLSTALSKKANKHLKSLAHKV